MKSAWLKPFLLISALLLLLTAAAGTEVYWQLSVQTNQQRVFDIEPGTNLAEISAELTETELLPMRNSVFKVLALLTRDKGPIKAGQYLVEPGMTARDLLGLFRSGQVMQHRATFPEGLNLREWRTLLTQLPYLSQETSDWSRTQLAQALGIDSDPEGWFFPDTYYYEKGVSDLTMLSRAHQRMQQQLQEVWRGRSQLDGLQSPYDALILASVIEKETGYEPDRQKVATVFHNRLRKGMRLQSDPTVIYGIGPEFDGNLTRVHLRTDTPYNSYTRAGLPPTPICSPGLASLRTAVQASDHPYIYFVAKGDGKSYFSVSLAEHNEAVRKYQLQGTP